MRTPLLAVAFLLPALAMAEPPAAAVPQASPEQLQAQLHVTFQELQMETAKFIEAQANNALLTNQIDGLKKQLAALQPKDEHQ